MLLALYTRKWQKKITMSTSVKLVLEQRRLKLSRAISTLVETGFPLTWGFEVEDTISSFSAPSPSRDFSDLDKSDLDRIFDSTKVLNVLNRLIP